MSDYQSLGLKVGIEIHQQLDTEHKLFCCCPTTHRDVEESDFEFFRYLRSKRSEIGEVDKAAQEEVARSKKFIYKSYDTTCLVEADEEPPRELNREAVQVAVLVAKMLNMAPADEVYMMRKIVIDGSNTTGFQRTALLAFNGYMEVDGDRIGVDSLCLEEEACRKIEEKIGEATYSLDRLGIPLVEIGTAADIKTPEQAKKVASRLGMMLRSTGKVKRGLGTIRQDVNISIREGARVEIKGVQTLDILDTSVEYEVERQQNLLEIRDELNSRNASVEQELFDLGEAFKNTGSKIMKKAKSIKCIKLNKFAGLIGREIQPGRRLGTEFADIARMYGLGGVFHTDELPAYGITEEEVEGIKQAAGSDGEDALIIAAGDASRVNSALERMIQRAQYCLTGVPEETRKSNEDGTTSYLRPLPGAARMYPETDVTPVTITEDMLEVEIPELIEDRARRYMDHYSLSKDLAQGMASSDNFELFEQYAERLSPTIAARVLYLAPAELRKDGVDITPLTTSHYHMVFELVEEGNIAKEGVEETLRMLCQNPSASKEDIVESVGKTEDLDSFVENLVEEKKDFIQEKGEHAFKPLMGIVMKEFRGKVDGKEIAEKLKKAIEKLQ
ncbi:MAG: Glu-tRNA(Gln) amidotransferase subunit GatE [Archaeoglobaceae archaeon]